VYPSTCWRFTTDGLKNLRLSRRRMMQQECLEALGVGVFYFLIGSIYLLSKVGAVGHHKLIFESNNSRSSNAPESADKKEKKEKRFVLLWLLWLFRLLWQFLFCHWFLLCCLYLLRRSKVFEAVGSNWRPTCFRHNRRH